MPGIFMTMPLARRSPSVVPRRFLSMPAGEGLLLAVTVVTDDTPSAAPVALGGSDVRTPRFLLYRPVQFRDYGLSLYNASLLQAIDGVLVPSVPGRINFTITPDEIGRYGWAVTLGQEATSQRLAWGVLQVSADPLVSP
ncbi:hypothetical protein RGI145_12340 [Roseomonas gilardii]|uniref:Uncharacterized protein n=1 Tax=Roseomonas gilardii TaxID=257708 RepID=A0A1L7AG82_9PROT|nr:hypothetical protein [Roseomonas gilardii]APT57783.1 hypothetical protein RGI145_12340 [Roseomonas gilardii]